eukprot:TRINITY_DN91701_c0_g1_i1.p1 TRINITY_DN91701_c0_g1~~TRINITY_DN91701_c0_g1_i1.p1  ORF type:complete len:457 (-),score=101.49 TRINITY_DN91701_c0_g1_i1:118-1488(-)
MIKGKVVPLLVGTLLFVSVLVIFLEWQAIHNVAAETRHRLPELTAKVLERADELGLHLPHPAIHVAGNQVAGLRQRAAKASQAGNKDAAEGHHEDGLLDRVRHLIDSTNADPATQQNPKNPELPSFPTPPEIRHRRCIGQKWELDKMPSITMVIPYLQEQWSQIRQTVGSVLALTPPELLDEILFIDDGNPPEWRFHENLTALHPKVRVHRNEERQGLIKAKVTGAALVKSPIVFFMEPHCIVVQDWLQPLVAELMNAHDHNTIVMPTLDIIPEKDFTEYRTANYHIGGFDWSLTFNWMKLIRDRNKSHVMPEPYPTPALSGGVFGIWKDFWERQGMYDTQMTEWGGEHIEMSLRTWRCGGRIVIVPCSHIGHVFRAKNPYPVHIREVIKNLKRAALVWLDEYLEKFFLEVPTARHLEAGDVSERLELKKQLQCKSMEWYIENIYPELRGKQPRRR